MSDPRDTAGPADGVEDNEYDPVNEAEDARRRAAEADLDVPIIDALRGSSSGPVVPVRLTAENSFCFRCHPAVPCWNECCHDTDITLTPYDLIQLGRLLDMRPGALAQVIATKEVHEPSGMPILKLKREDRGKEKKPCVFLDDEKGCTVYSARPAACRYYPLGLASVKMKGHEAPEDFYFLVKEPHCKGHEESQEQTVAEYRKDQGVELYDAYNRSWIHILMKLASWKTLGGPGGKEPDERTRKMFFMVSTDIDSFRRFVFDTSFLDKYEISAEARADLATDDEAILTLGLEWMRNILFNEPTIALKEHVLQAAIAKARRDIGGT